MTKWYSIQTTKVCRYWQFETIAIITSPPVCFQPHMRRNVRTKWDQNIVKLLMVKLVGECRFSYLLSEFRLWYLWPVAGRKVRRQWTCRNWLCLSLCQMKETHLFYWCLKEKVRWERNGNGTALFMFQGCGSTVQLTRPLGQYESLCNSKKSPNQ